MHAVAPCVCTHLGRQLGGAADQRCLGLGRLGAGGGLGGVLAGLGRQGRAVEPDDVVQENRLVVYDVLVVRLVKLFQSQARFRVKRVDNLFARHRGFMTLRRPRWSAGGYGGHVGGSPSLPAVYSRVFLSRPVHWVGVDSAGTAGHRQADGQGEQDKPTTG